MVRVANVSLVWTRHLHGEAAQSFESLLRNSVTVCSRYRNLILEKIEELRREAEAPTFDDQWSEKQAYLQGRIYELKQQLTLFDFLEK